MREYYEPDTSGTVLPLHRYDPKWGADPVGYSWLDFLPFERGYTVALFVSDAHGDLLTGRTEDGMRHRFSDLAPETRERITEDCGGFRPGPHPDLSPADYGREFWTGRQGGFAGWSVDRADYARRFPPLAPYLDDDGKVRFRQ